MNCLVLGMFKELPNIGHLSAAIPLCDKRNVVTGITADAKTLMRDLRSSIDWGVLVWPEFICNSYRVIWSLREAPYLNTTATSTWANFRGLLNPLTQQMHPSRPCSGAAPGRLELWTGRGCTPCYKRECTQSHVHAFSSAFPTFTAPPSALICNFWDGPIEVRLLALKGRCLVTGERHPWHSRVAMPFRI